MSLSKYYRFVLENKTGVSIAAGEIDLLINRSKIGPTDAAINHEASAVGLTNAGSIADNAFGIIGAVQDNSSGQFLEGVGHFLATISATTPNGDVILYMQESTNNSNWPDDDRASKIISVMTITTTTAEAKDFDF